MAASKYFIRQSEVPDYVPPNHHGTVNKRLVGPDTVGARTMEVVLGIVDGSGGEGGGSSLHRHAGIEQANYIIAGRARVQIGDDIQELGPGDACFFPADTDHAFTRIGDEPMKVLVIYSPPLNPKKG